MRMLRWISENAHKNRIQNEEIYLKVGVTPINKKMKEICLRWFGHVQSKAINVLIRKSELIQVEETQKGRGRPKITLVDVVKKDKSIKEVTEVMTMDRIERKKRIHKAIPN